MSRRAVLVLRAGGASPSPQAQELVEVPSDRDFGLWGNGVSIIA